MPADEMLTATRTVLAAPLLIAAAAASADDCLYTYRAEITEVYDGDTVTADIDLGLNIWVCDEKLRLARIDAPEVRGESHAAGLEARDGYGRGYWGKK